MLDPKFIKENLDYVNKKMGERGVPIGFGKFIALDEERRRVIHESEELEHERNRGSNKVRELKRVGKLEEAEKLQAQLKGTSEKIKELGDKRAEVEEEFREFLLRIPNLPHASVPFGKESPDNIQIKIWGYPKKCDYEPKDHGDMGKNRDIQYLYRATKITGG